MKNLFTFLVCLFLSLPLYSQVIHIETGTSPQSDHAYLSVSGGFQNFKDDTFTGGVIIKQYRGLKRVGFKTNVTITLNDWSYFYSTADAFFDKSEVYDHTFLEIGSGIGLRYYGFGLSVGYQMQDFNPVTQIKTDDLITFKLNYQIRL